MKICDLHEKFGRLLPGASWEGRLRRYPHSGNLLNTTPMKQREKSVPAECVVAKTPAHIRNPMDTMILARIIHEN